MATKSEFTSYATVFFEEEDKVMGYELDVRGIGPLGLQGRTAKQLEQILSRAAQQLHDAHGDLRLAALECRRRAAVCGEYATDMKQYKSDLAAWEERKRNFDPTNPWSTQPGRRPTEPARPAPWAEV